MHSTLELLAQIAGMARGLPTKSMLIEGKPGNAEPGTAGHGLEALGIDEMDLIAMAIQHKVARSALAGVGMLGIEISEKGRAALRMSAQASALRAALAAREAMTITQILARQGIASAVIKGPAAALQLYGNLAAREFYDLDIVANIEEAREAIPLMRELGFESDVRGPAKIAKKGGPARFNAGARPNPIAQRPHHIVFFHPGKPFRVELHDRAGWGAEIFGNDDIDAVFARIVMVGAAEAAGMSTGAVGNGTKLAGLASAATRFPSLCPVDHAVLLINHGTRHAWCLLHWLLDATAILSCKDSAFQEDLGAKLVALNMSRQIKVVCGLVRDLYPIEIPAPIKQIIDDEKKNLGGATRYARARLKKGGRDLGKFSHALALPLLFQASLLKSPGQKARALFAPFKISEGDLKAFPLPGALSYLHLFARPFFVIARRMTKK